jgi:hypothetical protein
LSCDIIGKEKGGLDTVKLKIAEFTPKRVRQRDNFLISSPIKYVKKIAVFVYRFQKPRLWRSNWKKQVFSDIIRLIRR